MPSTSTHPTLVGIHDHGRALGDEERARVLAALPAGSPAELIPGPRFVCARIGRQEAPGGGDRPESAYPVYCRLVGAVFSTKGEPVEVERRFAREYRRRGTALLEDVFGAFVMALWDGERGMGFLAQDQLGGRSLYYAARGSRLYFGSDVSALLRLLPMEPAPDMLVLAHKAANSMPPPERTVYEGVRRLCGGHALELGPGGWRRVRYWAPGYRPPSAMSPEEVQQGLWQAVSGAVGRRMGSGGSVGIVMSGGLDSSVVAAAAAARRSETGVSLRGYSAVFPGRSELDESEQVRRLTDHLSIPSVRIEPRPGGIVPLMLEYLERWAVPLAGPGYLIERPLIERAAAEGMTALLDGQGGDEVFGLSPALVADELGRGRLLSSFRMARRFPTRGDGSPSLRESLAIWKRFGLEYALPDAFHAEQATHRRRFWLDVLSPDMANLVQDTQQELAWRRDRSVPQWWALKSYLLVEGRERVGIPEYLRHRAAMAGLEARPPLLDLALVRFALSYPPELDFDRYSRPNLRGALRGRVPDAVRLDRRKSNLAPFYHEGWTGPELDLVRALLLDDRSHVRRLLKPGAAEQLLARPPEVGARGWIAFGPRVWGLLGVELFLRYHEDHGMRERLERSMRMVRPDARVLVAPGPD